MSWAPEATARRFWQKVDRSGGLFACWPWTSTFNRPSEKFRQRHRAGESRRPTFHLSGSRWKGTEVKVYAHRLALALTDGVPLWEREGLEACHRCGNAACVNPAHLYWGTAEENRRDRYGSL